jgi:hypothetical protein
MGSEHRAIDRMQVPVQLALGVSSGLHRDQELRPDPSPLPAVEAAGYGPPGAIACGEIPPGGAGAQNPEHAIQDASVINRRPTGFRCLWRKQWLQLLPLRISEIASVHTSQYNELNRVCKQTLALPDAGDADQASRAIR